MTDWAACLHCSGPVEGAPRMEARLCSPRCLEEGLRELQHLDTQLDLTRFTTDHDGRMTNATGGVPQLHRRSLLLHAIAAWAQHDADTLTEATVAVLDEESTASATPRA